MNRLFRILTVCIIVKRKRVFSFIDSQVPVFVLGQSVFGMVECDVHAVIVQNNLFDKQLYQLPRGQFQHIRKEFENVPARQSDFVFAFLCFDFYLQVGFLYLKFL